PCHVGSNRSCSSCEPPGKTLPLNQGDRTTGQRARPSVVGGSWPSRPPSSSPLTRWWTLSGAASLKCAAATTRSPATSWRRREHLLDRPALAAPLQQRLDPDARPLRPLGQRERLAVPGERFAAVVPGRGRVIAGRPVTREIPSPVEPSPLGVLAQRQVGLPLQGTPELLVADGRLAGDL